MNKPPFEYLYFGMASAEREAQKDPSRFLRTYYHNHDVQKTYRTKDNFLILGPKGSGKSSVSEYIRLRLIDDHGPHSVFSQTLNLDQVSPGLSPLSTISKKLVSDQAAGMTDSAWRLFIALRFFELIMRDSSASPNREPRMLQIARQLGEAGLIEDDFPSVLRKVRENKFSIALKGFLSGESSTKLTEEVPVTQLGESLLRIVIAAESSNHFLLSIDGLDRIIGDNKAYWLTLAALVRVADEIHGQLYSASADLRLLVMCRTDVFRKINFADADKITGDASLFLDWATHQTKAQDSPLWDYLSKKAEISTEVLFSYFPGYVTVGQRTGNPKRIPVAEYLLQSTRSTPREMTMLMLQLQRQVPHGGYLTGDRVRLGVDNFASRDLLTMVTAEATGILSAELHDKLHEIISRLPRATDLSIKELEGSLTGARLKREVANDLAEFLFLAGLIGNYDSQTGYVQFYHRRDTIKFRPDGPWMLHKGLMYAFNVPYGRAPS